MSASASMLTRLVRAFDRFVAIVGAVGLVISAITLLASFGLIVYSVAMRYFLNQPIVWVDELVGYLLVGIVMLAAADALRKGEHIAVDVLTERLGRRGRRWAAVFSLSAVFVTSTLFIVEGWETAAFSHMIGILSTGYLAMPMAIPQALIPIGGVLLALSALAGLARMAIGDLRPGAPAGASAKSEPSP